MGNVKALGETRSLDTRQKPIQLGIFGGDRSMTELPFGLKGRIYRSPMPYGTYDPQGVIFDEFVASGIQAVFVLASWDECVEKTGRDLAALYRDRGLTVVYLPIADFETPGLAETKKAIDEVLHLARTGKNVAIHCSAGIGRTGLIVACMAKVLFRLAGDEAISWTRSRIPRAIETKVQEHFVKMYG